MNEHDQTTVAVAISTVKRFLNSLEARDLERAQRVLSDDFTMEFPGGKRFASLDDLVGWAATRYRCARKHYDRFDALTEADTVIVYCFGTLSGEWLTGEAFAGIRFIDRFVMRNGQLVDQKVWNDLAEVRP